MVSIQRLFGFVLEKEFENIKKAGFNTTIVWVRLSIGELFGICRILFQYNDCLGSSYRTTKSVDVLNVFQYNDCLGSSINTPVLYQQYKEFQYNDCLGSSVLDISKEEYFELFQYNDCLGSSKNRRQRDKNKN